MPSKNETKIYSENCFYHLYNRGVEKREIFLDEMDYSTFLSYLKIYLIPKNEDELRNKLAEPELGWKEKDRILKLLRLNNFHNELKLLAYCLMPNHFHFLVFQKTINTIDQFMNSLMTRYAMYFNKKYKRVGHLFQGVYKAVLVESDDQLIHLSRYIHRQSLASQGQPLQGKPLPKPYPSSYLNYLGKISQEWVKPDEILSLLGLNKLLIQKDNISYKEFIEDKSIDSESIISSLIVD